MKTLNEMIQVMQAAQAGQPIEFKSSDGSIIRDWRLISPARIYWNWVECDYRVALTRPSIDWTHVAPQFRYLVRDKDGTCYLYTAKPYTDNFSIMFVLGSGSFCDATSHASLNPGTCPWQDSLVERPNSK